MNTFYDALIKKKISKHFHAMGFVTWKEGSEKVSLKNLTIKFRKNNYDSRIALSSFVSDLKKSGISSSMLKKILESRKNRSSMSVELRNKFFFQLVILFITAVGFMWSWGFISQDDLFTSQINSLVSVSISDVAEEKKRAD